MQPVASTPTGWSPSLHLGSANPLATLNLDQVAASTSQIRTVLSENPGLMVELKRLLALQATERGQLLTADDLTDQALYDKLDSDLKFRSACTRLLQRYGYLMPTINPKSEMGQERQFLIQERALQLAHLEQQESTMASQPSAQMANLCDPRIDPNCSAGQQNNYGIFNPRSPSAAPPNNFPPPSMTQPMPSTPAAPRGNQREILTSFPGGAGMGSTLGSLAAQPLGGTTSGLTTGSTAGYTGLGLNGSGGLGGADGLGAMASLDASGGLNQVPGLERNLPELSFPSAEGGQALEAGGAQPAIYSPRYWPGTNGNGFGSPYSPYGPWNGQPYRERPSELVPRKNPFANIPSLYDMYMQAAQQTTKPERFGLQVFQDTTASDQIIPMDLPVGPSYILGPGDGLTIDVWGGTSARLFRRVDRTGLSATDS